MELKKTGLVKINNFKINNIECGFGKSWNHIIDQNSYYFALRAKDKNTVQTVNIDLNIDLEL